MINPIVVVFVLVIIVMGFFFVEYIPASFTCIPTQDTCVEMNENGYTSFYKFMQFYSNP
ncbi:MAG: hypothetical protein HOD60_02080 [Candidatus Nitrosopelagicus sp.]|nr:hypothetical protein [Candidatus Nitrosopelagicus sp.]